MLEQAASVGRGRGAMERVTAALLRWDLHREAGMVVAASGPADEVGATIVNAAPMGPVALLAPCRVVALIAGPRRRGFAYGTLPGHPLVGEEPFTVKVGDDGEVWVRIRSFSRPVGLATLSPPVTRAGQRMINRRYLAAARRLAA